MSIPSAPPLNAINHNIAGYETATFNQGFVPLPAGFYEPNNFQPPAHRPEINFPTLTEETIRDALGDFVSEHCTYGRKPVQEMRILGFEPACAFHYVLETFTEKRETKWAFKPYGGEFLDSPLSGPAPLPWNVMLNSETANFENKTVKVQVPHTESVSQCHNCQGYGSKRCPQCLGQGIEECKHGEIEEQCKLCDNSNWKTCSKCTGRGEVRCDSCNGNGRLKFYIELAATFTNHKDEFVRREERNQHDSLPKKLSSAAGLDVFTEESLKVFPVPANFPDQGVLSASRRLLNTHEKYFQTERVHAQRHKIRAIPVTRVFSEYEGRQKTFFVYGLQNAVEFRDYYSKWGACSIL